MNHNASGNSSSPLDFLIIGAGMSGLCMAIQLKRAGRESFVLLEKSNEVGGTWLDNSYPNCGCDIPSYLYSYSFAPRTTWTQKYARQPEILQYFRDVADQFDIRKSVRFGQTVREARYDEASKLWHVTTESGEVWKARFLVSAVGQLNRPKIPAIPGADSFQGAAWHSAKWNRDVDLTGKRVAVIGNGASVIQFLPIIAQQAGHIDLFQRSPSWIHPLYNFHYTNFGKWWLTNVPFAAQMYRLSIFVDCEWKFIAFRKQGSLANRIYRWWLERKMKAVVRPDMHDALIPKYEPGCKRILLSSDYLQTVQRPNVSLITEPIESFDTKGIKTKSQHYPADVVIYGTGFRSTEFLQPMKIVGRRGESLDVAWQERPRALYGLMTPHFPNFFMLYGPNTNLGHNSIIYMVEGQVQYLMQCLSKMKTAGHQEIEVREEAVKSYNEEVQARLGKTVWAGECGSWYKTAEGVISNNWFGPAFMYRRRVKTPDFGAFAFQ